MSPLCPHYVPIRINGNLTLISICETMHLTLSQGLPIIYTKGEGVDGYFEDSNVGEAVNDLRDKEGIARKILLLSERLSPELSKDCIKESRRFHWKKISKKYGSTTNLMEIL